MIPCLGRARRGIVESPMAPEPRYRLAVADRALGRSDEAIEALQHALQLKPAYPEAHVLLGQIYEEQERWTDAIAAYTKAVDLKMKTTEVYERLGGAYRHTPEHDTARA